MLPVNAEGGTGKAPYAAWWQLWTDDKPEPTYETDDELPEDRDLTQHPDGDPKSAIAKARMRKLIARGGKGCVRTGINLGKYRNCETKPRVVVGPKRKRVTGPSALRPAKATKSKAKQSPRVRPQQDDDAEDEEDEEQEEQEEQAEDEGGDDDYNA